MGPDLRNEILQAAPQDEAYQNLKAAVLCGQETFYELVNDLVVCKDGRIYIPDSEPLRTQLLREAHDSPISGHLGRDKTLARLRPLYYWPGMGEAVKRYCQTCVVCQQIKPPNHKPRGLLQPLPVPPGRFHTWSLDFITGFPNSKRRNNAILVIQDSFTKFLKLLPTKITVTARETAYLFFRHVASVFGMPRRLISDRDPRFTSEFWKCFFKIMETHLGMSTAYHPQTDGQTERANQTVENMLKAYADDCKGIWDEFLPAIEHAYNTAVHASTGYTPYFLVFGQDPVTPLALAHSTALGEVAVPAVQEFLDNIHVAVQAVHDHLEAQRERNAHYANRHRMDGSFKVGEQVLLAVPEDQKDKKKKLDPRFEGPYTILAQTSPVNYKLHLSSADRRHPVVHVSRLRLYRDGQEEFPSRTTLPLQVDIKDEASARPIVEAIRDHRKITTSAGQTLTDLLVKLSDQPDLVWKAASPLQQEYPDLVQAYFADGPTPEISQSTSPSPDMVQFGGEDFQDTDGEWKQRAVLPYHKRPVGTRFSPRLQEPPTTKET